jgi:hypothetical protein
VRPLELCLILISPFNYLTMILLQDNPKPILSHWSLQMPCLFLSSKNGINSIFCLSGDIPIPVSITCVSRTYSVWSESTAYFERYIELKHPNFMSLLCFFLTGLQDKVMIMSPSSGLLYFTAFYTILNKINSYKFQSVIILNSNLCSLKTYTLILRL